MPVLSAFVAGALAVVHFVAGVILAVVYVVVHRPLLAFTVLAVVVLLNVVARAPEQTGRVLALAIHAPSLLLRRRSR